MSVLSLLLSFEGNNVHKILKYNIGCESRYEIPLNPMPTKETQEKIKKIQQIVTTRDEKKKKLRGLWLSEM